MRELRLNLALLIGYAAALPVSAIWAFCLVAKTPLTGFYLYLAGAASAGLVGSAFVLHFLTLCLGRKPS